MFKPCRCCSRPAIRAGADSSAEAVLNSRRDELKIFENPSGRAQVASFPCAAFSRWTSQANRSQPAQR